jgi:hypothetical protein
VTELEQAIRLRPHHYYQWLDLGVTLDRLNDLNGAFSAVTESVHLAPSFAQPRWQLGNFLYRQERYEEAFRELRYAAKSNPTFGEPLRDLAWVASAGNAEKLEEFVAPETQIDHILLARYSAKSGDGSEAVRQVREAGPANDGPSEVLAGEVVAQLVLNKQFIQAYDAWRLSRQRSVGSFDNAIGRILNGNFADPLPQDDPGFGWQLSLTPGVKAFIDPAGPPTGGRSIRFEFRGEDPPSARLLSQLVLLKTSTRYTVTLFARTEGLVTGGPPVILVSAIGKTETKTVGQSRPFPTGDSTWTALKVDFATENDTQAAIISLTRLSCDQSPCPIFGRLWLGDFAMSAN